MTMRNLIAAVAAVLLAACLNSTHPAAQRAQARHDIARAMAAESSGPSRKIVEVRDVTDDSAVVLTEEPGGGQPREERWVRGADGWRPAAGAAGPVAAGDR